MNFIDQIRRTVTIESPPRRIISLVPSQTELLAYFGLHEEVVGITKFCIHPDEWFRTKTRVGGTKNVNFNKIEQLKPDLIICNKEENNESDVKALMEKYPVWTSDIHNLDDAFNMITSLGEIIGKNDAAENLVFKIKRNFDELRHSQKAPQGALYLIWKNPYMAAGKDTFIDYMMEQCGFINVCYASHGRYPELTLEQIKALQPQVILLSSEPYPFKEKHITEFNIYFPGILAVLADGEYFSWYGSRLLAAPTYLESLIKNCIKV